MRRITISIIIIFLLATVGCQPVSPSDVEQVFQTKCVSIEDGFVDFGKITGNIISTVDFSSIIVTNNYGYQVYILDDLIANILPISGNLYFEAGWFTGFWFNSNGILIYKITLRASDSTIFWVVGELNPRNKNYRTLYVTKELSDWSIVGLLDDEHIVLRDNKRIDNLYLVLLNITTGNLETFSPSFSSIYSEIFWKPDGISRILNPIPWYEHQFSPNNSQVFLFVSNSSGMKYILWDNKRERIIWEKPALSPSPLKPQWSSLSDKIAYVDNEDLIILTKNGEENHLLLPSGKYLPAYMPFKWSPNGSLLAFWIGDSSRRDDAIQSFQFVVYDTKSNQMINTCIVSEGRNGEFFWSPDGKQIVVSEKSNQYLLLNIQEEHAFRFNFEQGEIIGWMK